MLGMFGFTPAFSRAAWAWGLALAVTLPAGAQTPAAAPAAGAQAPSALQRWHVRYDLGPDGRATMTQELHNQVLQAGALEDLKTYSIGFSNGIQQGQVLEAYTLKQDGRRIDVPANNFQTQTSDGHQGGKPFFSDRTRITVVFPDLAVGDTVAVKYRIEDKEAIFPGAFSVAHSFSPFMVHADSRITVRVPKGLPLRFEAHGLDEQPSAEEGELSVREWRYRNPQPRTWNEADEGVWRLEETPVLLASTFADYAAIARAYGERALPKAEPTERVRTLAQSIVGTVQEPRERARLLYEWVSTHITYGGNCIGVGAVVPRDTDTVLENRMGDCKDHATLLQALLGAAGIRSEQVLVNAGDTYDLPGLPVVASANHVINYLPDWQMYVDATAKQIPFGHLPANAYAKPVVHVGSQDPLRRIPAGPAAQAVQRVHTTMRVAADGSASGHLRVEFEGTQAARMRAYMRELQADVQRDFVRRLLARSGYKGKGELDRGDLSDALLLSDRYAVELRFDIDNFLQSGTQGAFVLAPVVDLPLSVVRLAVGDFTAPQRRVRCYGYHSEERYDITLAPGVQFTRLPEAFDSRHATLDYRGSYQRTAQGVQVLRSLHDHTPQGLCEPGYMRDWIAQAEPVARSLQGQVFYRLQKPTAAATSKNSGPKKKAVRKPKRR